MLTSGCVFDSFSSPVVETSGVTQTIAPAVEGVALTVPRIRVTPVGKDNSSFGNGVVLLSVETGEVNIVIFSGMNAF